MFFRKFRIDRIIQKKVLPTLSEMSLGDERYIVDEPKFRIKSEVSVDGTKKFTIHELSKDKKKWSYTTYRVTENDSTFVTRSGSYSGNWDK